MAGKKVRIFGRTLPAWALAAALVVATSGAAAGTVLVGSVTGDISATVSQALLINAAVTKLAVGSNDVDCFDIIERESEAAPNTAETATKGQAANAGMRDGARSRHQSLRHGFVVQVTEMAAALDIGGS